MRILKVNELSTYKDNILHFYTFDWDDNLLFMPTDIIVLDNNGNEIPVSTAEFAELRGEIGKGEFQFKGNTIVGYPMTDDGSINYDSAFRNFRDIKDPNIFLKDTKRAISMGSFGPSWGDFIECLTRGSLFAIITARGHESPSIRNVVEYIIDTELSDKQKQKMYDNLLKFTYLFNKNYGYDRILRGKLSDNTLVKEFLNKCEFIGVSAPSRINHENAMSPEKAKVEAILKFKGRINKFVGKIGMKAKIGFSDDDSKTVKHIEDIFDEVNHEEFPNIVQWVVKNTNDPSDISKKVIDR
tara:strand:- start:110071 stop:110964 length:894 start_codon:yes stop_codon:yes gene_type:complete